MYNNIAILFEVEQIYDFLAFIDSKELSENDIIAIPTEYEVEKKLEVLKIKYKSLKNYIGEDTFKNLDQKALHWGNNWFKLVGLKDVFNYREVNIAAMMSWELSYYFATVFRYIEIIKNIIKAESPRELLIPQVIYKEDVKLNLHFQLVQQTILEIAHFYKVIVKIIPEGNNEHVCDKSTRKIMFFKGVSKKVLKFLFTLFVFIINHINSVRNKEPTIKLLSLCPWKHISEVIEAMDYRVNVVWFNDTGPIMYKPIFNNIISLKAILKKRMYFIFERNLNSLINDKNTPDNDSKLNWQESYKSVNPKHKTFVYKNVDIWGIVKKSLFKILKKRLPFIAKEVDIAYDLLERKDIDIIVVQNDVTELRKVFVQVGKKLGIRSTVIQHGMIGHPIACLPLSANNFFAWGKINKEWLLARGAPARKIYITGCPRFDREYVQSDKITDQEKGNLSKRCIVFAPQHQNINTNFANLHVSSYELEEYFKDIIKTVKKLAVPLIIKLHPADQNASLHRKIALKIARDLKADVKVIKKANLKSIISECSALITFSSTVGLEAMLLGKPVISLWNSGKSAVANYVSQDSAIIVKSASELENVLRKILEDKTFREEIKKKIYKFLNRNYEFDGHSAKRIAKLIKFLSIK